MKKLPPRALWLWRARLTVCMLPAPLLVALFFPRSPVWNAVLTILWIAFYLFMFLFYYPVKHGKLRFGVNSHSFMVHCGVFYNRIKAMELKNVQHVTTSASPAERGMKLCSVTVWGAGGTIWVPSMEEADARHLLEALERREKGGRA